MCFWSNFVLKELIILLILRGYVLWKPFCIEIWIHVPLFRDYMREDLVTKVKIYDLTISLWTDSCTRIHLRPLQFNTFVFFSPSYDQLRQPKLTKCVSTRVIIKHARTIVTKAIRSWVQCVYSLCYRISEYIFTSQDASLYQTFYVLLLLLSFCTLLFR